jgi:molecular chaperone GrpE
MTEDRPKIHFTDKRGQKADAPAVPETEPQEPGLLDGLQQLADDRLDQLMRLKADFENFRKRELREKTELVERASLRLAEKILPVLDDLERALSAAKTHATDDTLLRGVELVSQKLQGVLSDEGLEQIDASGAFDPEHHEAVASVPGDVVVPTVLEVVRPGYKHKGKTIRPALVQVSVPEGSE